MLFSATTPSALELKQYRKMTPKKRILERNTAEQPINKAPRVTLSPTTIATKNSQKPLKKRIRKVASKQEDEEEAMDDEMADGASCGGGGVGGGSNGMTLEQFTEIVLASEGMAEAAAAAAAAAASVAVHAAPSTSFGQEVRLQRMPIVAHRCAGIVNSEEDNKGSIRPPSEDDLVANLIENNNDLIVEMKPLRPKPVVLSPRQPQGSHLPPYAHNLNPSLSTSVVVSVKPRLCNQSQSGFSAAHQPRLPPNKPQSIQRMMEEWFSKMQPPITEHEQALPALANTRNASSSSSAAAINLSTKSPKDCSSAPKALSRTTQVYPRPIMTPPKLSSPTSTSSGNSSLPIQKYNLEKRSTCNIPSTAVTSKKKVIPPQVEIKEMEDKLFHHEQHQDGRGRVRFSRQMSNTTCSETQIQLQDARLRALRDVEMALTRDMHGNL